MRKGFSKTGELKNSSYVKMPLGSSALIKTKNDDIYCFIWSIIASLHLCDKDHPNTLLN